MKQENFSKYNIKDIVTIISSVIALLCVIFRGKFSLLKEDKKCESKMKEAQFKYDLQKDMLKYRANMNNNGKVDSAEQVNEEHEWEDLSNVINDPDACQKIEYFPGTSGT